jgi:hypothetical protein
LVVGLGPRRKRLRGLVEAALAGPVVAAHLLVLAALVRQGRATQVVTELRKPHMAEAEEVAQVRLGAMLAVVRQVLAA